MLSTKKIAIVHDYIKEFGGAESVLENLLDIFPNAQVFTTLYKPEFLGPHQKRLNDKLKDKINTSFFQKIPFVHKIISPLRLISPLAFKSFDFSSYDIIISCATGAYFPNSLNKKDAKLICYCHTPPRYLYGLATARNFQNIPVLSFLIQIINRYLRTYDKKISKNVDQYIANSVTTSKRIKKYYNRDSVVINPPIDIPKKLEDFKKEDYFLTGGRLARAKRYDIAIEACKKIGVKLKIFGRDFAQYESELKSISNENIEFLGEIDSHQKLELYRHAKAFIFCSDNEDFGMVPVEAMSHGCPVVAYKSGGVTETVIEKKTGYFFEELETDSCVGAIKKIISHPILPIDCYERSKIFSKEEFVKKIEKIISLF